MDTENENSELQQQSLQQQQEPQEQQQPRQQQLPPVAALADALPRHSAFFLANGTFTIFLTASFVFGIKGAVVAVYHSTSTRPHVYSGDVGYMWGMFVPAAVFFVLLLVMLVAEVRVRWFVQHINAFLFFVSGQLLHSIAAFSACLGADPDICRYLYPVSSLRAAEAGVHLGLCALQWLTVVSFTVSLRWCRPHVARHFLLGGALFIGIVTAAVWAVAVDGAIESCGKTDTAIRGRAAGAPASLPFTMLAFPAAIALELVLELLTGAADSAGAWDDYVGTDRWWLRRSLHCAAVVTHFVLILLAASAGMFRSFLLWMLAVVVATAAIGPAAYWAREPAAAVIEWVRRQWGQRRDESVAETAGMYSDGSAMWQPPMQVRQPQYHHGGRIRLQPAKYKWGV